VNLRPFALSYADLRAQILCSPEGLTSDYNSQLTRYMGTTEMTTLTVFLTALSIAAYIYVGLSQRSHAKDEKQYFVAGQTVSANDYANVSVGYALQMAALFLFAYWGFVYGIGALWTALFWGLGYALLYYILPQFREYRDSAATHTLHSFIRKQFSSSRSLQLAAATATITGLLGTMFAEVDYTVAVYHPALRIRPVALQAAFLLFGVGYVIWNGYKAEVNTERIQVPLAYMGLLTVLFFAFPQVYVFSGRRPFWIVTGVTGGVLVIMVIAKSLDIAATSGTRKLRWLDWQVAIPLCGLLVLVIESIWTILVLRPGFSSTVFNVPLATQLYAQGLIGLLSLLIANALWMPVDISTWQRIGSVGGDDAAALSSLRRGTFRVMLESPASWCLGAVFGWTISAGGYVPKDYSDPYSVVAAFADRMFGGGLSSLLGGWQSILYPVFVVSCVAVMLSTVTSILSAVSFTADRDLFPDNADDVSRVRALSAGFLLVGFLIYEGLRSIFQANLATLLYGAYSAQLCLFLVTMLALYKRRLSARAALWSIVAGLLSATVATVIAVMKPDRPELAVVPPLFAVMGSFIGYILGYQLFESGRKSISSSETLK
jgi:Na+/proline symporter